MTDSSGGLSNLNVLQFAAWQRDVHLLEEAVARGAAIDYPVLDAHVGQGTAPAPRGTTPLLLACTILAAESHIPKRVKAQHPQLELNYQKYVECAIRLVELGADWTKRIQDKTAVGQPRRKPHVMFQKYYGKSARDLAIIAGRQKLVDTMNKFATNQDKIDNAHCRCGSRLPWRQCHAGANFSGRYSLEQGPKLLFRMSPLAICPCDNGCNGKKRKTHYKCCWNGTAQVTYIHDDSDMRCCALAMDFNGRGEISFIEKTRLRLRMARRGTLEGEKTESIDGQDQSRVQLLRMQTLILIQGEGIAAILSLTRAKRSITNLASWDPAVYLGCVERLEKIVFCWTDVHWELDESEVLRQAKEWNAALEQYCDDQGLAVGGGERLSITSKHRANPCAPCANPSCNAFEEKVKEFKKCSRCRAESYCSVACQRADYKCHKSAGCTEATLL